MRVALIGMKIQDSIKLDSRQLLYSLYQFHVDNILIERTYQEIVQFSRQATKSGVVSNRFPIAKLKSLGLCDPWELHGLGWYYQLSKSIRIVNEWFNTYEDETTLTEFFSQKHREDKAYQKRARIESERQAREFQQYFMSDKNIESMIRIIEDIIRKEHSTKLLLEPSCGDGRVINCTASAFQNTNSSLSFIGIDIDYIVAEKAAQATCHLPVHIVLGDFLKSTQKHLFDITSANRTYSHSTESIPCIVFGGPPYTLGGGSGLVSEAGGASHDSGRDLPLKFIVHSICVLNATAVVFVLPPRCATTRFIDQVRDCIDQYKYKYRDRGSEVLDLGDKSQSHTHTQAQAHGDTEQDSEYAFIRLGVGKKQDEEPDLDKAASPSLAPCYSPVIGDSMHGVDLTDRGGDNCESLAPPSPLAYVPSLSKDCDHGTVKFAENKQFKICEYERNASDVSEWWVDTWRCIDNEFTINGRLIRQPAIIQKWFINSSDTSKT